MSKKRNQPKKRRFKRRRKSAFKEALKNISPEAIERVKKQCEFLLKHINQ